MNTLIVILSLVIFGLIGYFAVDQEKSLKEKLAMTAGSSIPGLFMSLAMISTSA